MHRATMKCYYDYLKDNYNNEIIYLEYTKDITKQVIKKYKNIEIIKIYNPIDHKIMKEFTNISKKLSIELIIYNNPGFICTIEEYTEYLKTNKNKNSYFHLSFYIWCRKKYDLLMNKDKPIGNKWSFDLDNRLPFPKNYKGNKKEILVNTNKNSYIKEAKKYININFKNNHGSDEYYLPIDFKGAKKHFTAGTILNDTIYIKKNNLNTHYKNLGISANVNLAFRNFYISKSSRNENEFNLPLRFL